MMFRRRPPAWELKVTTPEGTVLEITTAELEELWRQAGRTNDGFALVLASKPFRLWAKPEGWTEPEGRIDQLAGTGSDPKGWRR